MGKIYENYFIPRAVAERYLKGRPQYHSLVIGKIKEFLKIDRNLSFALDVGCGTGFSSIVLKELSEKVVGLDISAEMLGLAKRKKGVEYILASAESLPLCAGKFDLITVSQAIHWFDRRKFFEEADRILKPKSWIVAYDNYFLGQMPDNPDFNDWYKEEFLKKFPTPPRAELSFETKSENPKYFVLVEENWHENTIELSPKEIVDFLITLTNVIALVENGKLSIEKVKQWIAKGIKPFFNKNERERFAFSAPIWYLRQEL